MPSVPAGWTAWRRFVLDKAFQILPKVSLNVIWQYISQCGYYSVSNVIRFPAVDQWVKGWIKKQQGQSIKVQML